MATSGVVRCAHSTDAKHPFHGIVSKVQKASERMNEGRRVGHDLAILFEDLRGLSPDHQAQILKGIKRIDAIFW